MTHEVICIDDSVRWNSDADDEGRCCLAKLRFGQRYTVVASICDGYGVFLAEIPSTKAFYGDRFVVAATIRSDAELEGAL